MNDSTVVCNKHIILCMNNSFESVLRTFITCPKLGYTVLPDNKHKDMLNRIDVSIIRYFIVYKGLMNLSFS